jgi:hypothetical protein
MTRRAAAMAALVVFALAAAWVLFIGLPRWYAGRRAPTAAVTGAPGTARSSRGGTSRAHGGSGGNSSPSATYAGGSAGVTDAAGDL